jgi:hypothetical protein
MSALCYLCLEEADPTNPFIAHSICKCRGSIQVHQLCFEIARLTAFTEDQCANCSICRTPYTVPTSRSILDSSWVREKAGLHIYHTATNVKHGPSLTFAMEGEKRVLVKREYYLNGKRNGPSLHYSAGKLVREELYERDVLSMERDYNENGSTRSQKTYKDGLLHGHAITLHDTYVESGSYENGEKIGFHVEIDTWNSEDCIGRGSYAATATATATAAVRDGTWTFSPLYSDDPHLIVHYMKGIVQSLYIKVYEREPVVEERIEAPVMVDDAAKK